MRSLLAASLAIAAPLGLAACVNSSYAGIPFAPNAADPELQNLARLARSGEKHAQLELGIRYEEGRGVPVDLERAGRLYTLAATDFGGTIGRWPDKIDLGPRREGLAEARTRLKRLRTRLERLR